MRVRIESATVDAKNPSGHEDQDSSVDDYERLKSDLELFSYITSHDLQSPLRIIMRTCEELNGHPAFVSDESGRTLLETLNGQSAHMKKLLEELLEYMRLETFAVKFSPLNSNEIIETSLTALDPEIKNTGAIITYDNLPVVFGHRGRLTRLFIHILDNALKFRIGTPKIHISARRVLNQWEFCVADNGIGINPEYHYIIFTLFQRLHTAEAYPGVGAGLALARKIVESHGGILRVESTLGQGSRFYFTLPAAP